MLSIWSTLWAIFRIKAKLFLKFFFYHFVEEKKVYNIYEIQRGTPKNDWTAVDILKNSTHFSLEKWLVMNSIS
jgi:hypothetical protein